MALRIVEVLAKAEDRPAAVEGLEQASAKAVWVEPIDDERVRVRAVVGAGASGPALDLLHERLVNTADYRILVMPLHATLPRPQATPGAEQRKVAASAAAVSREEVYASISDASELSFQYVAMVVLATAVAAIGLTTDNAAAVIGAMVVAPLLGPSMGLALGLTLADGNLVWGAIRTNAVGLLLAIVSAMALGMLLEVDPTGAEIASRTRLGASDMLLALAAGCAGTLAYTTGAPAYLIGVMVAVALLPPAAVAGLLLAQGHLSGAGSALLLAAVNVVGVVLAAMLTFVLRGMRPRFWWEQARARRSTRLGIAGFVALVALLLLLVRLTQQWTAS